MKPPRIRESPPPVLRDEELQMLLSTGRKGQGFEGGLDYALLCMFVDTGARRAEVAGLRWMPGGRNSFDRPAAPRGKGKPLRSASS